MPHKGRQHTIKYFCEDTEQIKPAHNNPVFKKSIIDTYKCFQRTAFEEKRRKVFWHIYIYIFSLHWLSSLGFAASPQIRLHPNDLLLLLPDDAAQAGQQWVLIAPGVRGQAVVQTRQLVQQRLLALWTRQQLLLWPAVTLELWPDKWNNKPQSKICANLCFVICTPTLKSRWGRRRGCETGFDVSHL